MSLPDRGIHPVESDINGAIGRFSLFRVESEGLPLSRFVVRSRRAFVPATATQKSDPCGPAVSARVAPELLLLTAGQQPVDRRVHIQVIGFPAPGHHHIGAPEEPDQDAAWHFEQRVAVG